MIEMYLFYAKSQVKDAESAENDGNIEKALELYDSANLNAFAALEGVIKVNGGFAGHNPDILCDPLSVCVKTANALNRLKSPNAMHPGVFLKFARDKWDDVAARDWFKEMESGLEK